MKRFLLISIILLSSCSVKKEPVAASPVPAVPDVKDVIDDVVDKVESDIMPLVNKYIPKIPGR